MSFSSEAIRNGIEGNRRSICINVVGNKTYLWVSEKRNPEIASCATNRGRYV